MKLSRVLAAGALVAPCAVALPVFTEVGSAATPITQVFSFTGGVQTYTVPPGVCHIDIVVEGAQGGAGGSTVAPAQGGEGGTGEVDNYSVAPGEVLTVVVGGQGGSGTESNPPPNEP